MIFCCRATCNSYRVVRIPCFIVQTSHKVTVLTTRALVTHDYIASFHSVTCCNRTCAAVDCNLVSPITRSNRTSRSINSNLFCRISAKCNYIVQGHLNSSAVNGSLDVSVAFKVDYFTKRFLHGLTILCFKTEALCLDVFYCSMQLTAIYSIFAACSNCTIFYTSDFLITRINAVFCYLRTIFDGQTIFVDRNSFVTTIVDLQAIFSQLSRFISAIFDSYAICIHLSVACSYCVCCNSIYIKISSQCYFHSTIIYRCSNICTVTFHSHSITKRFLNRSAIFSS